MRKSRLAVLLILATPVKAETILYGKHTRYVDIRSTSHSLLLFPLPPVSVSCHPDGVKFEPVDEASLNSQESSYLGNKPSEDLPFDSILSNMLRAKPQRKEGETNCSFVLSNGTEVPIIFSLKDSIATPFIEFKPLGEASLAKKNGDSDYFSILVSLSNGESFGLIEVKDTREGTQKSHTTDRSSYILEYQGANDHVAGFRIRSRVLKDSTFGELSQLEVSGYLLKYSLTVPQKTSFQKGDIVYHYIVADASLSKEELWKLMP